MSPRTAIAGVAALLVAVLVGGQLAGPMIAERRVAGDLERLGPRPDVDVDAFPWPKLLAGRADRVEVRFTRARFAGAREVADLVADTADAEEVEATFDELQVATLGLREARYTKDGEAVRGEGLVSAEALRAAVPPPLDVTPVGVDERGLLFEGGVQVLGRRIEGTARAEALDGRLVVVPQIPFGGLATLTVFADRRVAVTGVGGEQAGPDYLLRVDGRVAG
jgi:hypothetical protein